MSSDTNADDRKLAQYAKRVEDDSMPERWWFSHPSAWHSREAALQIIDACLTLELPVTDVMTAAAWFTLVRMVATMRQRIETLEDRA